MQLRFHANEVIFIPALLHMVVSSLHTLAIPLAPPPLPQKEFCGRPCRPVVSNCGTPKEKISKFVDFYLWPIVKTLPLAIKDTTEFLCKLKELGDIPEEAIIYSMNVVGLYLHIPQGERLESIREVMQE